MKGIITKDDKAVSPIIATILLIAITVVLAATLVSILGGFTHGASGSAATASVSTQFSSTGSGSSYTTSVFLNVSSFSASNVSSSKIAITLTLTAGSVTTTYSGYLGGTLTNSATFASSTPYFTGGSDYEITVTGSSQVTSATVQLTYSGSVIYSSGPTT